MEKVVGADKGAEVPVIEPNKSEVSAAKKEDFYTKMQNKMIDLRKQSNIYLNHAPKSEKYGLCQRIRNLEDEIFGLLIEARKRYWNKTSLTKLDVAHEQLRGYWRLFYELGYCYVRYVDDMVFVVRDKAEANRILAEVQAFLADRLCLELSKWRIQPLSKGVNFAGFRTWQNYRLIRKRSLHNFGRKLAKKDIESVSAILAHAMRSSSYRHLLNRVLDKWGPEEIRQLCDRQRADLRKILFPQDEAPVFP